MQQHPIPANEQEKRIINMQPAAPRPHHHGRNQSGAPLLLFWRSLGQPVERKRSTEAVDIAEVCRDAFAARVASSASGIDDERLRVMWIQNRIQFKNPLIDILKRAVAHAAGSVRGDA